MNRITGPWKVRDVIWLAVLAAGVGLSCVRTASLRGRVCPCAVEEGFVCCDATQICVLAGMLGGCDGHPVDQRGVTETPAADALTDAGETVDGPGCVGAGCQPALAWTRPFAYGYGTTAAVAPDGSVFIAGITLGMMGDGAFVVKLDLQGQQRWIYQLRGSVTPGAVAVLADGSVAVVGSFWGTLDFDPSPTPDLHAAGTNRATFVTRLMPDGAYGWTRTLNDHPDDKTRPIEVTVAATPEGGLLVGGMFSDRFDLDPTAAVEEQVSAIGDDTPYLVKLSVTGSYVWGRVFDESDTNSSLDGLAVDGAGNAALAVSLIGMMDADPGPGVLMIPAGRNAFRHVVVVLDGAGRYRWSHPFDLGTNFSQHELLLGFASDGDLVAAGTFDGRADFDPLGAGNRVMAPAGARQVFLTRLVGATGTERSTAMMKTLGSAKVHSLVPATGNGVFTAITHDLAIEIGAGSGGLIKRSPDGARSSLRLVQLSSAGSYVSDTTVVADDRALVAGRDADFVVLDRGPDVEPKLSRFRPARP